MLGRTESTIICCMVEVQLPLVLFCWGGPSGRAECLDVLDDVFEVRLLAPGDDLADALEDEVEVVVVPMDDVDAAPDALLSDLSGPGQTVPTAGILPADGDPAGAADEMETVRPPVEPDALRAFVRTVRKRARYEATVDRFYQLASELAERETGEMGQDATELAELREKMAALERSLDETQAVLDDADIRALFREF